MKIEYNPDALFIPLISDYGFKAVFGNEQNTLFLRKALQALIRSETPIREVTFDKNAFEGILKDSRGGYFDLSCVDEAGTHFIVEMQLGDQADFLQRMKFYALHRLDTMVQRGRFGYGNLSRIYCIGILANNILPYADYHTVGNLRNERGELLDEQLTFIVIELDKFNRTETDVQTDLDKLLYTMKTIHTVQEPTQFPAFWTEEWLQVAIDELSKRNMTPEERFAYVVTMSNNAEAVRQEKKRTEQAISEAKAEAVRRALRGGKLNVEEIAEYNGVPVDYVLKLKNEPTA